MTGPERARSIEPKSGSGGGLRPSSAPMMTTQGNDHANYHHHHHHQKVQNYHPPGAGRRHHYLGPRMSSSSSSSAASFKGCCCCLLLLLVFLALLALAVVLVVVLALKPKKPQFDLQQVSVQYLLFAPSATTTTAAAIAGGAPPAAYLSLNITLLFTAENPNKVGIRYGGTAFEVMYGGVPLGVATVPGFEQPAHSRRLVESRVTVDRFNVLQADAADLVRDAAVYDHVEFRITGDVGAKIQVLGLTSPRVQVSVDCAVAISPRRQSVTYKQCGVEGVKF